MCRCKCQRYIYFLRVIGVSNSNRKNIAPLMLFVENGFPGNDTDFTS
jgi:hypothetical protein